MEGTMAMEKVQSVGELAARVAADPELQKALKENPVQVLSSFAAPLRSDVMIYRVVVAALGLTLMVAAIGVIALAFSKRLFRTLLLPLAQDASALWRASWHHRPWLESSPNYQFCGTVHRDQIESAP
jgi:hypothetical protein